jgi:hypothetical protein
MYGPGASRLDRLASVCNAVTPNCELVFIERPGEEPIAPIAAS